MKKTLLTVLFISIFYIAISNIMVKSLEIPDEAIRIRVVPNSNSSEDQSIKNKVKDELQIKIYKMLKETKNIDEAETIIENNLETIKSDINKVLKKEEYNRHFDLNYGLNYFPKKEYKGIVYKEGYYKSLLVTLGEGKGDNWWCVLFPPLCLIEAEENTDIEYKSLVKELIDRYL